MHKLSQIIREEVYKALKENYVSLKRGMTMKHKHLKDITIELIEPTQKGWKVSVSDKSWKKGKPKIQFFRDDELSGKSAIFEP